MKKLILIFMIIIKSHVYGDDTMGRFIDPYHVSLYPQQNDDPHFVMTPKQSVPRKNVLFIFLPGTKTKPSSYEKIIEQASSMGYHAIALGYTNTTSITRTCENVTKDGCFERMRREIITGEDLSPDIFVDEIDCIEGLLEKLLIYLNKYYHHEGWGEYYKQKNILWEKIIVAGHSQGGGNAAFLGKMHKVKRVVIFASADYRYNVNKPASWLKVPGKTPPSQYYALGHVRDRTFSPAVFLSCMGPKGLGLPGKAVLIDTTSVSKISSHILLTNLEPSREAATEWPFHNAPVIDEDTPKDKTGKPKLSRVWKYLIGDDVKGTNKR